MPGPDPASPILSTAGDSKEFRGRMTPFWTALFFYNSLQYIN